MALSEQEMDDLRQVIFSGAVGIPTPQGVKLNAQGLKDLRTKSDEEVRAMIVLWKGNKKEFLTKQLLNIQNQLEILNMPSVADAGITP